MKIVFMSDKVPPDYLDASGAIAMSLAAFMAGKGHEASVITTVSDRRLAGVSDAGPVRVYKIFSEVSAAWQPYACMYNPSTVSAVSAILRKLTLDVIHAHDLHHHLSYHCLQVAKRTGARVFLTHHDAQSFSYGKISEFRKDAAYIPENLILKMGFFGSMRRNRLQFNPFRNAYIRHCLRSVRQITVSQALKHTLAANGFDGVGVIHNGLDAGRWSRDEKDVEDFLKKFDLAGKKIVLFGGRISAAKGGAKIVEAMRRIAAQVPDSRLFVMGDGGQFVQRMTDQAEKLGIRDKVVFSGWLSGRELSAAYHAASVVTVPSIYLDPFPTITLEAMACRKPVVATIFGGAKEAVTDGKTGFIVNPFDTEELASKIVLLLADAGMSKRFGQAGYERFVGEFSLNRCAGEYVAAYAG